MMQSKVKIISNQKLSGNYWHLEFESARIAKRACPGQFLEVKVNFQSDPLLRRPISIHGVSGAKVKLIYAVVGRGTQILSEKKPNELLDIIGPLGNGFDYSRTSKFDNSQTVIVAGGMGAAPLVFLAQKLNQPLILIGARSKKQIICGREFKALGCAVRLATDDGSAGFKGRVTDLLKAVLQKNKVLNLFSCGPRPMLKNVARIAAENNISAQLSLEEHMACGIGACLGCVVLTKAGYQSVCKDGPVFPSQELIW